MNPDPRKPGTYELPRGSAVGKYEIMRRLAVGGMAEIYLARVTGAAGFEKLVVLKRILPNVAEDPTFVNMFLDEARLAATLRHPNIADVYDVGECDGTYFFTMEYVYGEDVRTLRYDVRKRNESIPLAIALAIVHGTASALDHAHEKVGPDGKRLELVHRDVSASNVMVSYDGAVKLLDFGIARAASSTHKTQTGTLKGKIPYMSPEQCKGLPLDRRSDLFSVGVLLYELTVGKRPFRGETDFAIMDQIVYQGAKPPSEVVSGYPPELEAIVMKLLARGPSMRYATGEQLLHDLDAFVAKHGLWLSARALGKYMRTLFADKIAAWEQAEQQGVPFAQHVAHTITSQSQRSELMTPPSEFPGVGPRTTSQQMAAVQAPIGQRTASEQMAAMQAPIGRRTSKPMPAMQPLVPVTPQPLLPQSNAPDSEPFVRQSASIARQSGSHDRQSESHARQSASHARQSASHDKQSYARQAEAFARESEAFARQSEPVASVYPALKPRSSRTIFLAFIGALVLGAGGVVGYMLNQSNKAVVAGESDEATQMESIDSPPGTASAEANVGAKADSNVGAKADSNVGAKADSKAEAKAPKAEANVDAKAEAKADPKADADKIEANADKSAAKVPTVPVVDTQPTVPVIKETATKPEPKVAKPPAVQASPPKKPVQKPVRTTKPKKPPTTTEPKEQTWDPNSPFLPQ